MWEAAPEVRDVRLGLQIPDFNGAGGARQLGGQLAAVARTADEAGFDSIGVMDHFFQISMIGPPEQDMLEAYTTLGYLAACTSRARLLTLVTGAVYRHPGILGKIVTTLDVLSGGRAWLGIGAAWNGRRLAGLASRSRRWPSGSSGSRRRCASACRCGRVTSRRSAASTIS